MVRHPVQLASSHHGKANMKLPALFSPFSPLLSLALSPVCTEATTKSLPAVSMIPRMARLFPTPSSQPSWSTLYVLQSPSLNEKSHLTCINRLSSSSAVSKDSSTPEKADEVRSPCNNIYLTFIRAASRARHDTEPGVLGIIIDLNLGWHCI